MQPLIGLNIFRAIAVIMMIIAHSIRIQSNYSYLSKHAEIQTFWDKCLLFFIQIEPIISAQFLFISGFSLTLSLFKAKEKKGAFNNRKWLSALPSKLLLLYAISVLFFIGDNGIQTPDLFVSSGILSIIALSMALTAIMLTTARPIIMLSIATLIVSFCAYTLEQSKTVVIGLNGGAGGCIPLISMTFVGAIIGLIYQRFHMHGLVAAAFIGSFIGLLTLTSHYPWVVDVRSQFQLFSGDPVSAVLHSFQYLVGYGNITPQKINVLFWNHSAIFLFRVSGALTLILLLFILAFRSTKKTPFPTTAMLNEIGQHALLVYVLHLLLLGLLEITGLKPATGWQTWILVVLLVLLGAGVIRMRNKTGEFRQKLLDSFDPGTQ